LFTKTDKSLLERLVDSGWLKCSLFKYCRVFYSGLLVILLAGQAGLTKGMAKFVRGLFFVEIQ
jgi:hypothetical protein